MNSNTSDGSVPSLECPRPYWPSTAACSGRGDCVQGQCICHPGWTSKHDFFDTTGSDCVTDLRARQVLFSIAYAVVGLLLLSAAYMLLKHRPIVLFNSQLRKKTRSKYIYMQSMLFLQIFIGFCSLVTIVLALWTPYYLRESVAQTILVLAINLGLYSSAAIQSNSLMRFALTAIIENRHKTILATMRKLLFGLWCFVCLGISSTLIANLIVESPSAHEIVSRIYFGFWSFGAYGIFLIALKYGLEILKTLKQAASMHATTKLDAAMQRLRVVVIRIVGIMFLFGSICLINALIPLVLAQAYPVAGLFICLNGLIRVWNEFRPDAELDPGAGTNSSLASSATKGTGSGSASLSRSDSAV